MTSGNIIDLIVLIPLFLLSVSIHEFSHAWAADRLGDPTPRAMGRLTINPRAHIDPLGAVMFVIAFFSRFFIGWAKPVPVNIYNFRHPRRDFALVAISGPASNLIQALGWYLIWLAFLMAPASAVKEIASALCGMGVVLNVALLCFNLIPVPPLDGSRLLAWLLPAEQAAHLDRLEPYGFLILLLLIWTGVLDIIYPPLFGMMIRIFPGI